MILKFLLLGCCSGSFVYPFPLLECNKSRLMTREVKKKGENITRKLDKDIEKCDDVC